MAFNNVMDNYGSMRLTLISSFDNMESSLIRSRSYTICRIKIGAHVYLPAESILELFIAGVKGLLLAKNYPQSPTETC
jgi:hypothetical protein